MVWANSLQRDFPLAYCTLVDVELDWLDFWDLDCALDADFYCIITFDPHSFIAHLKDSYSTTIYVLRNLCYMSKRSF